MFFQVSKPPKLAWKSRTCVLNDVFNNLEDTKEVLIKASKDFTDERTFEYSPVKEVSFEMYQSNFY